MANPSQPLSPHERLELASRLFREFRTQCFWHSPSELAITEDLIPFVIKGLRGHGGHRGFRFAAELERAVVSSNADEESKPCR
jgi:hypothetical protein